LANLETTYVGLKLKSPIVVASAGITETVDRMRKCQENGAGAVVMKSYFEEEISRRSPTPRFRVIRHDMGKNKTFTFMSYEQASEWDIERYAQEVKDAKAQLDIKIFPSINCITREGWVESAKMLEQAGADGIELNTSCPHGSITFRGGAVEHTIVETVKPVREAVSIPLVAKISPMLTSPLMLVKALEETGVDGVTMFNRMTALEIDIEEERPIMHGGYAGHGGPWAIQYPLRWISQVRPEVKLDIAGSGGVSTWQDVVKYLLVGATVVQTCTAVYLNGYEVIGELLRGLEEFMDRKGYRTIDEFRGKVNPRILGTHDIDRRKKVQAEIGRECIPPCKAACPAGVPAQSYVRLIAEGMYAEALELIRSRNPFQSVCGRVCYHPCEDRCTRRLLDEPVAIRALKRFVIEWGEEHAPLSNVKIEKAPDTGKRVAVIGAGLAGLSAAHDLAKLGHSVTVFEAESVAGGMLVLGIPKYRLPRDVVEKEIAYIERLGVEIKLNHALGRDITLPGLRADGYDAVLIATGAHKSVKLGVPGEDHEDVVPALEFLKKVNLEGTASVGRRVCVVGGGNSALDAARCALRLGAEEVYLAYRRTKEEMPAGEWEIADAEDEGVRIIYLARPIEVVVESGKIAGLKCVGGYLGRPGPDGRRQPCSVDGAEYVLPADMVITAVSQTPDPSVLRGEGMPNVDDHGVVAADAETGATNVKGVFAAGDVAGRPGSVIEAIAHGKQAAVAVDAFLKGEPLPRPAAESEVDQRRVLARFVEEATAQRVAISCVDAETRRSSFVEVEKTLSERDARREAERCLACGCGVGCGLCRRTCIYGAIEQVEDRFRVDEQKCDGCGLCAEVCRNENIKMVPRSDVE